MCWGRLWSMDMGIYLVYLVLEEFLTVLVRDGFLRFELSLFVLSCLDDDLITIYLIIILQFVVYLYFTMFEYDFISYGRMMIDDSCGFSPHIRVI